MQRFLVVPVRPGPCHGASDSELTHVFKLKFRVKPFGQSRLASTHKRASYGHGVVDSEAEAEANQRWGGRRSPVEVGRSTRTNSIAHDDSIRFRFKFRLTWSIRAVTRDPVIGGGPAASS